MELQRRILLLAVLNSHPKTRAERAFHRWSGARFWTPVVLNIQKHANPRQCIRFFNDELMIRHGFHVE